VLSNSETVGRLKEHINLPFEIVATEQDLLLLRAGFGDEKEHQEEKSSSGKV
jgi:hypothetical protein